MAYWIISRSFSARVVSAMGQAAEGVDMVAFGGRKKDLFRLSLGSLLGSPVGSYDCWNVCILSYPRILTLPCSPLQIL